MASRPNLFSPPLVGAQKGASGQGMYDPWLPKIDAVPDGLSGMHRLGQAGLAATQQLHQQATTQTRPEQSGSRAWWNSATQEWYVQGRQFPGRDARTALETKGLLNQPPIGRPEGAGWMPIPDDTYAAYLDSIENPTRGTLFSQNFASGVDQLKELGGNALMAATAGRVGQGIAERASERIDQLSPYRREFTDIPEAGEGAVLDWFVSVLGSQGPMILESVAAALIGGIAGSTIGGPGMGAATGTLAATFKKKAFKEAVQKAAAKYARKEALDPAEKKILKSAAAATGAAATMAASNVAIGTGDIYGERREQGLAEPGDWQSSLISIAGSVPYAAMETLPELMIFGRLMGKGGGRPALNTIKGIGGKSAEVGKRFAMGVGKVGTAEGLTEGGQETLVMGLSGQDLTSPEALKRYINSITAGFAVGGTVGGLSSLRNGEPASLLEETPPETPAAEEAPEQPTPNPLAPVGEATVIPGPRLGDGRQGVLPFGEFGRTTRRDLSRAGDLSSQPTLVWNPETLQYEQVNSDPNLPAVVPPVDPNAPVQGEFDFTAPEAPTAPRFGQETGETQMGAALQQAQRDNAFLRMRREREAQKEADFARMENIGRAQGQLNLLTPEERAVVEQQLPQAELPMAQEPVPVDRSAELAALRQEAIDQNRGRAPIGQLRLMAERIQLPPEDMGSTQAPLFNQQQTPRPSKADRLRRGIDASQQRNEALLGEARDTAYDIALDAQQGRAQQNLFTQRGQPTVAAMKAAGEQTRVNPEAQEQPEPQVREARGFKKKPRTKKKAATKKAATKKAATKKAATKKTSALRRGTKTKQETTDAVQEQSTAPVDVPEQAEAGEGIRGQDTQEQPPARASRTETAEREERPVPQGEPVQIVAKDAKEQWEDNFDFPYESLPSDLREQWEDAFARGKANAVLAQSIYTNLEFTPTEAMLYADPASKEFYDAAEKVIDDAYFNTESNDNKPGGPVEVARAFMQGTEFTDIQNEKINKIFGDILRQLTRREARKKGEAQPWFEFAYQRGLLKEAPQLEIIGLGESVAKQLLEDGVIQQTNLPVSVQKKLGFTQTRSAQGTNPLEDMPGAQLAVLIENTNTNTASRRADARKRLVEKARDLWEEAQAKNQTDAKTSDGTPIGDYFETDGTPRLLFPKQRAYFTNVELTKEKRAELERQIEEDINTIARAQKAEQLLEDEVSTEVDPDVETAEKVENKLKRGRKKLPAGEPELQNSDYEKWSSGRMSTTDGKAITNPVPMGKIKMIVSSFVRGLARAPKVWIYKNQADLKARNPELYKKAKKARGKADFDNASAAGYAFDGQILIFSDRIMTEAHLRFVLAHEAVGHYGLRALIPQGKFDALMRGIYRDNPAIQGDVDAAMNANPEMDLAEAVEEYLSDYAGVIDTSVIRRIWDAIKGVLNKLGIKFGDETARYLVYQARRYVRTGQTSAMFDPAKVARDIQSLNEGDIANGGGRFSTVVVSDAKVIDDQMAAGAAYVHLAGEYGFKTFDAAAKSVKDFLRNTGAKWDRFKAEVFSLSNFRARENPGLLEFFKILSAATHMAMTQKITSNEALRPVLNRAIGNKVGGIKNEEIERINKALYAGQRWAVSRLKSLSELGKQPLYKFVDGELVETRDKDGVSFINKIAERGRIEFKMMRDGFEYEIQIPKGEGFVTKTEKFDGIPGITENSIEWKGYEAVRGEMERIELALLRAQYQDTTYGRKVAFDEVATMMINQRLTAEDRDFINYAYKLYRSMYFTGKGEDEKGYTKLDSAAMTKANEFLVLLNSAIIGEQTDRIDKLHEFMKDNPNYFKNKVPDDVVAQLEKFRERVDVSDEAENKYVMQDKIKQILLAEAARDDADLYTKRTLATGYTPIIREGTYQMRIEAVSAKTGERVRLLESYRNLLTYSMFENQTQAEDMAEFVNNTIRKDDKGRDILHEVMAFNPDEGKYTMQKVRLVALAEAAKTEVSAPPELNLNEFVRGLHHFNFAIPPKKLEEVVVALTKQNSKARTRLERAFTRGDKGQAILAVSRHIESRASTIAKTAVRSRLYELMNMRLRKSNELWYAEEKVDLRDPETGEYYRESKLEWLKKAAERIAADPNAIEADKVEAQRNYERYKYMVDTTNPPAVKGKKRASRGNLYYNQASRTMAFLDGNKNIEESDFASGKTASRIRGWTSLMFLGGSVATGALNLIALQSNSIPYLASYNPKNGFGGGYGLGPSYAALMTALGQVGTIGFRKLSANRAEYYIDIARKIANDPRIQRLEGLTEREARFIAREIREGVMIPALSNSLIGTARGMATSGAAQQGMDAWMTPFNLTEQASRRALGLAAYRLEFAKQLEILRANGIAETTENLDKIESLARARAVEAIDNTLGEYSVLNRPAFWRTGLQSFLFMFKVFPTMSIQLLSRMDKQGQAAMVGSLMVMGGVSALPFAEDLEDIIDTIGQALGWKKGALRYEAAKMIDAVVPGASRILLSGMANELFPGNLATRIALGDFIPGTGILLAGADVGRELTEIGGPAPAAIIGMARFLTDIARLPTARMTAVDALRDSPITMMRAVGDAYTYFQNGAIVDRRGYVVSPDVAPRARRWRSATSWQEIYVRCAKHNSQQASVCARAHRERRGPISSRQSN